LHTQIQIETFTRRSLYTEQPFTHRSFYTQKPLRTEAFAQRSFYTEQFLHTYYALNTGTFTSRCRYTKIFYAHKLSHAEAFTQSSLVTQKLLHTQKTLRTEAFTQSCFCTRFCTNVFTQRLLQTGVFMHRSFYIKQSLEWGRHFDTQRLVHTENFCTQTPFDKEVFARRSL